MQINIRTENERILKELNNYKTNTLGVTIAVEYYTAIRRGVINNLKGKFTHQELVVLIDIVNGWLIEPKLLVSNRCLIWQLEDAQQYESVCDRHEADYKELHEKLEELEAIELIVLTEWSKNFWVSGKEKFNSSFDEYFKELLS